MSISASEFLKLCDIFGVVTGGGGSGPPLSPIGAHSFLANTAGISGIPGSTPLSIVLQTANNLSELTATAATVRTNLGIGTLGTQASNAVSITGGSAILSTLIAGYRYQAVIADFSIAATQSNVLFDTTATPIDIAGDIGLTNVVNGFSFAIKNTSTGTNTFTPLAGEFIDGMASLSITPQSGYLIVKTPTQWSIVADKESALGTVTSVATGPGLLGGTITSTGTISFATIANNYLFANITGSAGIPSGVTATAYLDSAFNNTQGSILYRNATVWTTLPPGSSGQVLASGGAAANPAWAAAGGAGTVTSVATGTGLTGGTITGTGTISFATVPTLNVLANITGGTAAPIPNTLTSVIDAALGATQGDVLYRNASAWVVLPPGTATQYLASGGAAANISWASIPATGVTSVATGTGLTGGTITGTGTISFATVPTLNILANLTGGVAAPIPNTLTAIIDAAIGNVQGDILYRNSTGWVALPPGTATQYLASGGAAANPAWTTLPTGGTVTSVGSGTGLTGGPITGSGTLSFATIATMNILSNITVGTAVPIANTLTGIIDAAIGNVQGNVLYRGASAWGVLAPGTSGQVLQTNGPAANPSWATAAAGGLTNLNYLLIGA